jgi:LPS-assembly protein
MTIVRSAMLAVLLPCCVGMAAHAEEMAAENNGATIIDAQRIEVYLDHKMRAFGDAEINRDGMYISGDRIDLNMINSEVHAIGHVHLKQGDTTAEGQELQLKTDAREGEMKQPIFHLGGEGDKKSRGSAETVLFEGPIKERMKDVRYTTCPDGVDDWYLRAKDMEIDHHSQTVTATNASLEFKGVPILYTPWIDYPFSNQRKSGFLTPTIGSTTRNGFEFMLPYYWNIGPDMDATIAPRYLGKRGLQLNGEFRYLDPTYHGTDSIEYLPSDNQTGTNRYLFDLNHNQVFGGGWSGSFQFQDVSDDDYFSDMSTRLTLTSKVNLPQQGRLRYDSESWHFSALAQQFETLDKQSYPYQRLPQLSLTGDEEFGPLETHLWTEAVRFGKDSAAPVNVTGDRYTAYPSVSLPLVQSYGFVTPKIGLHYTNYALKDAGTRMDSSSVTLPIFSLDSGLYFDRDMRVVKNHYTQTLEPRLFYVYIPYKDQSRLPNFDTAQADLNITSIFMENQFSGGDRVNDANHVALALTSRLIDQKTGKQRLAATLAQRFYFDDQQVTACAPNSDPLSPVCKIPSPTSNNLKSDLIAALSAQLTNGWRADAAWQYDTDIGQYTKANVSTQYEPEPGKVLNLSYRFTRSYLEQIDVSAEWPLGGKWYGLGRYNYSLMDNPPTNVRGPVAYIAGVEYDAGCWQGRAVLEKIPTVNNTNSTSSNYAFFVQLELNGLSSIGSNPLELLKRSIPGYTNTNLVPAR